MEGRQESGFVLRDNRCFGCDKVTQNKVDHELGLDERRGWSRDGLFVTTSDSETNFKNEWDLLLSLGVSSVADPQDRDECLLAPAKYRFSSAKIPSHLIDDSSSWVRAIKIAETLRPMDAGSHNHVQPSFIPRPELPITGLPERNDTPPLPSHTPTHPSTHTLTHSLTHSLSFALATVDAQRVEPDLETR